MENNNTRQIVGAIVLAGAMIAGAILIRGGSAPSGPVPISKQVGLNVRKFNSCVESGKFKAKVQADIDDGVKAGVSGTPASFIVKDGVVVDMINGALPYENVIAQIEASKADGKEPIEATIRPISADDHIIGDPNAKIIIVEYSDLDCPFCKVFHGTMHRIVEENKDVAWVYRHYPLTQLHPNALAKAEETECAWEQGGNDAFWKYADKVFEVAK